LEIRADIPTKPVHLTLNTKQEVPLPGVEGGHKPLKIFLFLYFQTSQAAIEKISMKYVDENCCLTF
jgi:hypothetical protein